jgi:hypothetical protein
MRRSGVGSGGGYRMNKHRDVRAPKVEPRAREMRPAGVAQLGQKQGSHSTHEGDSSYRGERMRGGAGYNNPVGPTNMALQGPGAGKNAIMPSGSQSCHGPVAGTRRPQGRDILNNE